MFRSLRDVATHYGFSDVARQLSDLVLHSDGTPMQDPASERYKLEPTAYDRAMFRDLVDLDRRAIAKKYPDVFYKNGKIYSTAPAPLWTYWYFWTEVERYITEGQTLPTRADYDQSILRGRLMALSTVLFEDFRLIAITLGAGDDAQVIFETLNSGGKPLAAMDLVRNDVFHRATICTESAQEPNFHADPQFPDLAPLRLVWQIRVLSSGTAVPGTKP